MKRSLGLLLLLVLPACGTDVSGPAAALLSCAYGNTTQIDPGGVLQLQGAANQALCPTSDASAPGEFVYIPFFGTGSQDDSEVVLPLEITGGGISSSVSQMRESSDPSDPVFLTCAGGAGADGGPEAFRRSLPIDHGFHDRLRRREIRELTPLLRGGTGPAAGPLAATSAPDVPRMGELMDLNVAISCTREDLRTGRVMHVSEHAVVVADTANPAGLTPEDYAYFGVTFDTLVYPVETAHFGTPGDIDDNDRSILFFTRAVNELNPADGEGPVTIGFFWSGDLFPTESTARLEACPAGNQAEMFYLFAPDPEGVAGRAIELDAIRDRAIPLIGHEFQHLVNASRRMFVNEAVTFEEPWLNEGLSHAAEELLFFEAAGLEPLMDLTADDIRAAPNGVAAFNEYMGGNVTNFGRYLARPDTASLMGIDGLTTRGAAWAFLRYAADRSGRGDEAFFFDVVNSAVAGLDNLSGVLGPDNPLDWMHDWTASVYSDNHVPGIAAAFTQPSWDLRAVYEGTDVGEYPLEVRTLSRNDPLRVELLPGGAAYTLFSLQPDGQGLLQVQSEGGEPPSSLRGSLVRIR